MSLIASTVGALMALLPAARPKPTRDERIEELRRQLDDAYRELDLERDLTAHWREQARLMAVQVRVSREADERVREQELMRMNGRNALAYAQQNAQNAQTLQAQAQARMIGAEMQMLGLQQYRNQAYGSFCNCVPSRAQMFAAEQALAACPLGGIVRLNPES